MSMYMYLEVGTTHFYHLVLFNLVLGFTSIFIEIQEVQMMNGSHWTIITEKRPIE